jgi:hypothetical protein
MSGKKDKKPTSYANPAFDEKPIRTENSGEPSPMGSDIFIVKPDGKKGSRSHPDAFRHEPITQQNIGRSILRGVRCKYLIFSFLFNRSIFIKNLALWATRQTEKDLGENKDLYVKTTIRELILYLVYISVLCISKCRFYSFYINKKKMFIL